MRIGLLGGTFDPIHIGHLILASCAREQLNADLFLFLPNNRSPLKSESPVAPYADRYKMLQLAIADVPGFAVSDIEGRRGGTSYTIHTLRELKRQYPDDEFHLVLGQDALADFASWKEHQDVLTLAQLAAVQRDKSAPWTTEFPVTRIDMPAINISATVIRQRLCEQKPIDFYVPARVVEFIKKHNLYMSPQHERG